MRICDLLLGPISGWARFVDPLDEATRQLRVDLDGRREADVELEALRTSSA
jgi:imidazoleglycerol phosphate dehydratase HisB